MTDHQETLLHWEEIAEENPGAYEAWQEHLFKNAAEYYYSRVEAYQENSEDYFPMFIGHLLAFFDDHGIYVLSKRFSAGTWGRWIWKLWNPDDRYSAYGSRTEALAAAFTEAFRILEVKLNSKP